MFRHLCSLLATCVLVGTPVHALADVLVTLEAERFEGRLANRDAILEIGSLPPTVSILVGEGNDTTLHRFERDEVDYVLLDVDGETKVFDGKTVVNRGPKAAATTGSSNSAVGPVLIASGIGVIVLSALNPQGGPELSVGESSASFDEETYNVANYAGFGLGAILILAGAREANKARSRSISPADGLARSLRVGPRGIALSVRF